MLVLERYSLSDTETEGKLLLPDDTEFYTIEKPWKQNAAKVSCVPLGKYKLVPYSSAKFKNVYALENLDLGVSIQPRDGFRSNILIHAANFASQLEGCIAPGMERNFLNDARRNGRSVPAVSKSKEACGLIFSFLSANPETRILDIVQRVF